MYEQFFNFKLQPFSIAPDPSFLYLSTAHSEALAHLSYGFTQGGFVMITGEVGTGKTTLLRDLLRQTPADIDVAFILNPRLTVRELLETLCDELGIPFDSDKVTSVKRFIDLLTRHLLQTHQSGRSTVMIIDEAQNLSPAVLEQVRLLTNLETDERKLLRIILIGQPELAELLDRTELRQLAQRITARYHLNSLDRADTTAYVMHRLSRAGGNPHLFSSAALRRLYSLSKGIPRVINVIADRALLGAYVEGKRQVNATIVNRAAREVLGKGADKRKWFLSAAALIIAGAAWALLETMEIPFPADESDQPVSVVDAADPEVTVDGPEASIAQRPQSPQSALAAAQVMSKSEAIIASETTQAPVPPTSSEVPAPAPQDEIITPQTYELNRAARESSEESAFQTPGSAEVARPSGNAYLNRRLAYRAVFQRWGVTFETSQSNQIPCDFAPTAGLQCLSQQGDWQTLGQLDLPVILELRDAEPAPFYAALTYLNDTSVTLQIAETTLETTQRAIRDLWSGAYVVLWQMPPGYYGNLRQGQRHETVGWLRQHLSGFSSRSLANPQPNRFDENLRQAVIEFQQAEGLQIDGVVGPATWIRLAERLGLPQPSLAG